MKRILTLMSVMMIFSLSWAKPITIDDSLLSDNQKTLIETSEKIQTAGKWVGLGKEIGSAVNDGLSSLTDQANKFANTKVGTWTMLLVTYKVIGRDIIRYAAGIFAFLVGVLILIWQFRLGYVSQKIRTKGNFFQGIWGTAEYKVIEPDDSEKERAFWTLIIGLPIITIIAAMTMFA